MYWLKKNIGKIPMDEISVSDHLWELCKEQEGCLDLSFPTISAYGANAAMCHYSATEESNARLEPKGLYLVDSGRQYYEGTTDITRTIALGPLTDEEKGALYPGCREVCCGWEQSVSFMDAEA